MFFCHEILQRRNGSFGIIWLAAMQNRSLTRREYEKVKISEKCGEILNYILARVKTSSDRTRRFSLYLSAQLMYGTVKVFYEQNKYLLTDCLEAERKLKRVVIQDISVIPDAALLSNRRLCVTEDFSVITPCVLDDMILNPHIRQCVDLLQVSIDFLRESEEEIEQSLQSVNHSKNTAPAHSITMQESSNHSSHVFQNTQVAPELDLPPMTAEDFERFEIEIPISPIKHVPELSPSSRPEQEPMCTEATNVEMGELPLAVQNQLEQTPTVQPDNADRAPARPGKRKSSSSDLDAEIEDRRKRPKISALVLPPLESEVIVTDKRARSANTRLLIDDEKRLDKELWKGWQENHAATTKTPILPDNFPSLEELMTTPGCLDNFNSISMREWFRSMCKPPAVTRQLPAERSGHDATANIAETELPRQVASANVSRDEKLLKSMETTMNRSANISTRIETPNISNVANKTSFRTVTEESANKIIPPPEPINEQMFPPDQPDQLELMEEMQLPPEQPLEEQPVPQTENMQSADHSIPQPEAPGVADPETPALIIDNERFQQDAEAAATPRTLSTKAKLTRSLKRNFQEKNSVVFTELDDLIQPKRTSRQEVAKLFHALLVMAKRKHVEIRQDESYGPIIITRYSE